MKINNPIISKNFQYSNLLLNDEGLFYKVITNAKHGIWDKVFITKDPNIIYGLLDLNFLELSGMDEISFYEELAKSPKIRIEKFKDLKPNNSSKDLERFANFLQDTEVEINTAFTPVTFNKFSSISDTFIEDLETSLLWLSDRHNVNRYFREFVDIIKSTDFDITKLNDVLPGFKKSLGTKKESELFMILNAPREVYKKFVQYTGVSVAA